MNQLVICAMKYLIAIVFVAAVSQTALAQVWPVNSPEVYEPVPQYSPRYPLKEQATVQVSPTKDVESTLNPTTDDVVLPGCDCGTYGQRCVLAIDTRTPSNRCNSCVRPSARQPRFACDLTGWRGRPYIDKTPGGCQPGQEPGRGRHGPGSALVPRLLQRVQPDDEPVGRDRVHRATLDRFACPLLRGRLPWGSRPCSLFALRSSSFQCVVPPVVRAGLLRGSGAVVQPLWSNGLGLRPWSFCNYLLKRLSA
jgi:hypothetical protein